MHLDNKGWSMSAFLIEAAIILFALLVVTFLIIKLTTNVVNNNQDIDYKQIESNIRKATKEYRNLEYINIEDSTIYVSIKTLEEYNLFTNTNNCNGYGVINIRDSRTSYSAYISCNNYKTDGYDASRLRNIN